MGWDRMGYDMIGGGGRLVAWDQIGCDGDGRGSAVQDRATRSASWVASGAVVLDFVLRKWWRDGASACCWRCTRCGLRLGSGWMTGWMGRWDLLAVGSTAQRRGQASCIRSCITLKSIGRPLPLLLLPSYRTRSTARS
jgi:hypothetical protein